MQSDIYRYDTSKLRDEAGKCEDISDIEKIIEMLQEERPFWSEQINRIIAENRYTKTKFAELCGVSRPAVLKWCNGSIPSSRDDYIRIGFAAKYSLDGMNYFLQRYGKYPALYPKSLEDSVYIFVLNSDTYPHTYDFCKQTIKQIKDAILQKNTNGTHVYETDFLRKEILNLTSVDQLESFIEENAASYGSAYEKFYNQVIAILMANAVSAGMTYADQPSINGLAEAQGWTSSMKQCVSGIRCRTWFPFRRKVIALGIHLNLTVSQIDNLLEYAKMEPLCAKNPVECAIIFAITDAELNNRILDNEDGSMLYEYVHKTLTKLNITDAKLLLNDIGDY